MPTKKKTKQKRVKRPAARKPASKAVQKKAAARPKRKTPESLRLRSASPSVTVNDLEKSLAFYRDVLGFHVKERWMHDGKLAGVELVAGVVSFFVGQDDWKKGKDRVKGEGFRIFCTTVQNIDALALLIKSRGGKLLEEPKDQSWGTRDFAVADPDGFKITFSTVMK